MLGKYFRPITLGLLIGLVGVMTLAACGGEEEATQVSVPTVPPPPEATASSPTIDVIKFHDGQWGSNWVHMAVSRYIIENGYGVPTEEIQGTTGTQKLTLIEGDVHVNMEMWRMNIPDWYWKHTASGELVDLAGITDPQTILPEGSKGQTISFGGQGFYIPTYVAEANPGLKSVTDLPDYKHLFTDPNDPSKGAVFNCIIGWQCQKINHAKWFAYDLYEDFNMIEPGGAAALKAAVVGPYEAEEPFVSYYWEPTDVVNLRDMTLLEEPAWTAECQAAMDLAVADEPYESTMGCAYPSGDAHTGVHRSLVVQYPEIAELLANVYIGLTPLATLEGWKADNDAEWVDVGVKYLNENRDAWTSWITDDNADEIIANVDAELALE